METLWKWIKRWAFLEGLVVGALACHYVYHEFRIDEIKDKYEAKEQALDSLLLTRDNDIQGLKNRIAKAEQYEQKYIAEASRALTLERKLSDLLVDQEGLSRRYSDLIAMKWEEKCNAEKLSRISLEEETAGLRQRLATAQSGQATADPHLLGQIEVLTEQNRILAKERDELRKLYASAPRSGSGQSTTATPFPVDALAGVSGVDAGNTIIRIVATLKPPVDVSSFIAALAKALIKDRANVVKRCATSLAYPLTSEQMKAISTLVWVTDSGATMQVLLEEQAKH